ncbi:Orofacial cleft 1 candidate gene 1 protein -like protein [Channa argus]|uniref:Orofacial cleft 1 candidate gene 1 protein-like protein n=1 Tax=Channa argus TaxID=215402 RepID=A0A6G1QM66_CHAAH|nr:Orofacial cleft 1 candidate gene 1 protein -like protein [Channa argus]
MAASLLINVSPSADVPGALRNWLNAALAALFAAPTHTRTLSRCSVNICTHNVAKKRRWVGIRFDLSRDNIIGIRDVKGERGLKKVEMARQPSCQPASQPATEIKLLKGKERLLIPTCLSGDLQTHSFSDISVQLVQELLHMCVWVTDCVLITLTTELTMEGKNSDLARCIAEITPKKKGDSVALHGMKGFVWHTLAIVQRSGSASDDLLQSVEMDTFGSKLQQKALQQPKQKKSKSAEFLMGRDERAALVGIENPAFDGGGSAELSVPSLWLGREIRGDRPDSTLAAHQKKMELQAPAKERGNEHAQNYFDPLSAEQTDPRHSRMVGVSTEDELELTTLHEDENRLYQRMAALLDEDDTFIDIPGMLVASRDEEVLEVKAGDPVFQQRLLLHDGGGEASSSRPSQAHTTAKTEASAGLGGDAGLRAGRMFLVIMDDCAGRHDDNINYCTQDLLLCLVVLWVGGSRTPALSDECGSEFNEMTSSRQR